MSFPLPNLVLSCDTPANAQSVFAGREWLVTNGLGGHASGTLLGPPTRRFHGFFVPNLHSPRGRHVLVPRLDDGLSTPQGHAALAPQLTEFRLDGTIPVWRFSLEGRVIERAVVMPHGRNAACVRWQLVSGPPCRLQLRPFVAARRQDALLEPDEQPPFVQLPATDSGVNFDLDCGVGLRLQVLPEGAAFVADPQVERDVFFATEHERGYDHSGRQHSPGYWSVELGPGRGVAFAATLLDEPALADPAMLFDAEHDRIAGLLRAAGMPTPSQAPQDEVQARLVLAADAFIVLPGSRSDEADAGERDADLRSVMAGYHWFNDWGRDTMIALEGLTLATGRHAEARAILRTFAGYIRDGLIPNLFPEGGREGLYHTVDATLWFFHALDRYARHSGDWTLLGELYPALRDVIGHHVRGTHFGIGMDPADGLLHAGAEGVQLTWMDAKMGDWVVTPRRGKPVEIQGLWFNALRLMAEWARRLDAPDDGFEAKAQRASDSFNRRYWSASRGHLFDVIDGPDGDDASLRPNQVFTMSLAHPVLAREHRRPVLETVRRELLTPLGLRTLAPADPAYRPRYEGDLRSRDGAYHQGTVWPWLLGHFVDAWLREFGDRGEARAFLHALPQHLATAGVGHVSEVFDAEPPHRPGGCIAQAWSAAELLRAWQNTAEETPHG